MTKEDIMKMNDRELYRKIVLFVTPKDEVDTMIESGADTIFAQDSEHNLEMALWWCYQAEEKVREMGDSVFEQLGVNLDTILEKEDYGSQSLADIAHAYPKQRVQAILLTLKELEEP